MSFIYPNILWGLFAIAIPIIIHLFNFRRFRKVYFTNVRYLEELKLENKRKTRLQHLLTLLMRILAIAALVMAFAQPYIPQKDTAIDQRAGHAVSIFVDNSFSMEGRTGTGSLFDGAVNKAREIAMTFGTSDEFQLLTHDFEGKHQRLVARDEFLDYLQDISITPSVKNLSEVIRRQEDILLEKQGLNKSVFIISDFQKSISDIGDITVDSTINLFYVPVSSFSQDNLFIDSCWFESPVHQLNQNVKLMARINNRSETDYEKIPVKLYINNSQKALASFNLRAGQYIDVELPFTIKQPGYQYATIEITDYPITYDDKFYLNFLVKEALPIMAINAGQESSYLNALFGNDEAFDFINTQVNTLNYAAFRNYNLIILNGLEQVSSGLASELKDFVGSGGSLLVIPPVDPDRRSYRLFLRELDAPGYSGRNTIQTRVNYIEEEHPVFRDVFEKGSRRENENIDLPAVKTYYALTDRPGSGMVTLLRLENRQPFLSSKEFGKGSLYLLTVPLDDAFSNFHRHAIFVPTLFNIGLLSAATAPLYYFIDSDEVITYEGERPQGDDVYKIRNIDRDYEFIPEVRMVNNQANILVYDQVAEAGQYEMHYNNEVLKALSFNYDRRESDLSYLDAEKIIELSEAAGIRSAQILNEAETPISQQLKDIKQGQKLWRLFIIFALVFLAVETFLLRFWR